ncbi:bleomycin resistance protein [Streptomyces niveus]|uniref:Bleomycin resistance protein n=1 Tax=Streptomyces niveus TaxID=193462 RepID=A0A1U9QTC7_STRNV|nr:VOC family protein [Streptomyces niveus]AQU67243.1 bleomycin resistance protein [Streptomyces niveus]
MTEKTIPLLPCQTIQPVVDFYSALGFEVTFIQKSPYAYAVVERGDVELQFFGMKKYDPTQSFSGCYVLTDDVDGLHGAFRAGLKSAYGRIPTRGLPRIGPVKDMSYGVRQFLMTDPAGNTIRIGQPNDAESDGHHQPAPKEPFARALHLAVVFADSKQDLGAAVKILDRALRDALEAGEGDEDIRKEGASPTAVQLYRLLVLRGDVAQRLDETEEARGFLDRAAAVELTAAERTEVGDDTERAAELLESLQDEDRDHDQGRERVR